MILVRIVADVFGENCYVVADESARVALVVDPGHPTAAAVAAALAENGLTLGAVLLTHGHPDHVWDAAAVAGDAAVYVPGPDAYRLDDPLGRRSVLTPVLTELLPLPWTRPERVADLAAAALEGGGTELVPGVVVRAVPAPGHTEGSTVYLLAGEWGTSVAAMTGAPAPSAGPRPLMLAGDVLFRGGAGRTDLPGGDPDVMNQTLRTLRQVIDPETSVLPGHGPGTTMARELATNPFLRAFA